jgi:hypothetical protein
VTGVLIEISIVLAMINLAVAVFVVGNRFVIRRAENRYGAALARTRPIMLDWIDGIEVVIPTMRPVEQRAFINLLAKYGRSLRGDGRRRVTELAERTELTGVVLKMTRSRRAWRRAAGAFRLGDIGADHTGLLVSMLSDPDRRVRNAAARSLGKQGSIAAVAPIVVSLSSGDVARAVGGQALIDIGASAADALARLLESQTREVRATAAELLGRVGTTDHGQILVDHLDNPDPEVRVAVVRSLGRLGGRVAASAVRPLLSDPVPFVRAAAATSMARLGNSDATAALIEMAKVDSFLPAHAAAQAAAELDPEWVVAAADATHSPHLVEAADIVRMG